MRVPTALIACSFTLVGCLEVTTTQVGPPSLGFDRPRLAPDQVAIYRTEEQVPGEYQEVALLHVTGSEAWSTESEVYQKMREEAARLGANAVILQPVREPSTREKIAARRLNLDMGRDGRAIAIYLLPSGSAPPAANGSGAAAARDHGGAYTIFLENGSMLPAASVEPAGVGQIKAALPDGTVRYLSSSKVKAITDREGRDWTKWALDDRRLLPRTTGLF